MTVTIVTVTNPAELHEAASQLQGKIDQLDDSFAGSAGLFNQAVVVAGLGQDEKYVKVEKRCGEY